MLIERIGAIHDLRGQMTDIHRAGVKWMNPRHDDGPSWTVPLMSDRSTHRCDIARLARDLQMRYDLAE